MRWVPILCVLWQVALHSCTVLGMTQDSPIENKQKRTTIRKRKTSQCQNTKRDSAAATTTTSSEKDSAEHLLLKEGLLRSLPKSRCSNGGKGKNVILAIGDGMGWEMVRAGAIARQVLDELASLGCNTTVGGCPNEEVTRTVFQGRTLADYYTQGKGHGLSFQSLEGYALVTNSAVLVNDTNPGNHYAPSESMLGDIEKRDTGRGSLMRDECGNPIDFNPLDISEGGNMVLWNDEKGGAYPWDELYSENEKETASGRRFVSNFDPTFIMQHAIDSAASATALATGQKVANKMVSVNLYEKEIPTILEDAMKCGMAGGVVSSVPILHATPAAFVTHSNNRQNHYELRRSFRKTNPTLAMGTCADNLFPTDWDLRNMGDGPEGANWVFFEPKPNATANIFYDGIDTLHPDQGDHVLACLGTEKNAPYRGTDSSYSGRRCENGIIQRNAGLPTGILSNAQVCNRNKPLSVDKIPHMSQNVKKALEFLSKDEQGMFLVYEQGDIDMAAHANHMDDMLGTLLDFEESVGVIIEFIAENGGWEKNALYVTADHDHYLTLLPNFPEILANMIISGESHDMTPSTYSNRNPWETAIEAGRHEDVNNKTQLEHLRDFSTWTEEDILKTGHFWGPRDAGGNGWGSHSTRPVPLFYQGDDGCLEALLGKGYSVLGKDVKGAPGKVDQVHLHACMAKNLFALDDIESSTDAESSASSLEISNFLTTAFILMVATFTAW